MLTTIYTTALLWKMEHGLWACSDRFNLRPTVGGLPPVEAKGIWRREWRGRILHQEYHSCTYSTIHIMIDSVRVDWACIVFTQIRETTNAGDTLPVCWPIAQCLLPACVRECKKGVVLCLLGIHVSSKQGICWQLLNSSSRRHSSTFKVGLTLCAPATFPLWSWRVLQN